MSFGVAQFDFQETGESLIERADKFMYLSKEKGRNRVSPSSDDSANHEFEIIDVKMMR